MSKKLKRITYSFHNNSGRGNSPHEYYEDGTTPLPVVIRSIFDTSTTEVGNVAFEDEFVGWVHENSLVLDQWINTCDNMDVVLTIHTEDLNYVSVNLWNLPGPNDTRNVGFAEVDADRCESVWVHIDDVTEEIEQFSTEIASLSKHELIDIVVANKYPMLRDNV